MQVSIEAAEGLERKLKVGVEATKVDTEVNSRLQKASKTARIDGFRPGKVPLRVLRQRYGLGIRQEVVGEMMNNSFYEAITQENIRPAGRPSIEILKDEPGQDLEFLATLEVFPEVVLGDLGTISVARPTAEVTDEDLDRTVEKLREQVANWEAVERAAAKGDQVNIDYKGTKDGEAFDGGTAEGSDLELGSGQMIPGFEDAIEGMAAGEEKTVPLKFPGDYHAEALKGADVEFTIKVNAVKEKKLPELNDEFFVIFGVKEGGEEAFRKEVRKNMERELRNILKTKLKDQVMDQLVAMHELPIPAASVTSEIQTLKQQMLGQFGGAASQKLDTSFLPDDMFKEQAERRVALGLILSKVVESAELKADADKVRAHIEEMASTYDQAEEVINYYYSNQQALAGIESMVLEEQVVEHILANAKVTEESLSYEDAVKQNPSAGSGGFGM